jgi:hypothetical protein
MFSLFYKLSFNSKGNFLPIAMGFSLQMSFIEAEFYLNDLPLFSANFCLKNTVAVQLPRF